MDGVIAKRWKRDTKEEDQKFECLFSHFSCMVILECRNDCSESRLDYTFVSKHNMLYQQSKIIQYHTQTLQTVESQKGL